MLRSGDKRAEVEISREKCSEVEIPELVEMCWKPEVGWPLERGLMWREWGCIRGGAVGCRRGFLFAMYRNWLSDWVVQWEGVCQGCRSAVSSPGLTSRDFESVPE